jgi:hypothetical protein
MGMTMPAPSRVLPSTPAEQLSLGLTQRWRDRQEFFRDASAPIATRLYEVAPIPDDTTARAFIERHHYSGAYVAARRRFGLYRATDLVGVAVYSQPVNNKALDVLQVGDAGIELGRLVLLDDEREPGGNAESWFVARCHELLAREGFEGVLSFSDPVARTRLDGTVVHPGHVGILYQALNARVAGRGAPQILRLLPDGRAVNKRSLQKIRAGERGGGADARLVADLVAAGAVPFDPADPAGWVAREVPRVTRALRHNGNIRYLFGLTKRLRRMHRPNPAEYPAPRGGRVPPKYGRRARAAAAA